MNAQLVQVILRRFLNTAQLRGAPSSTLWDRYFLRYSDLRRKERRADPANSSWPAKRSRDADNFLDSEGIQRAHRHDSAKRHSKLGVAAHAARIDPVGQ